MIIARFTYDPVVNCYSGMLATLRLRERHVTIESLQEPWPGGPDYFMIAHTPLGRIPIGSARSAITCTGAPVLGVEINDPTFAQPLKAVLCREQGSAYALVWVRLLPWPLRMLRRLSFLMRR